MHFSKKLLLLVSFAGLNAAAYDISPEHKKNLEHIVEVFDKALAPELARLEENICSSECNGNTVDVNELLQQVIEPVKTKFAHVFNNDLTYKQRALVINLLRNLKVISMTTTGDLMLMAQAALSSELRQVSNEVVKTHFGDEYKRPEDSADMTTMCRKLEKIDLGNPSLNAMTKFMCQSCYVQDLCLIDSIRTQSGEKLLLQKYLHYAADAIATPFVVFNDSYFFPGWEDEFKKVGDTFAVVHTISTQLLEAIEQSLKPTFIFRGWQAGALPMSWLNGNMVF